MHLNKLEDAQMRSMAVNLYGHCVVPHFEQMSRYYVVRAQWLAWGGVLGASVLMFLWVWMSLSLEVVFFSFVLNSVVFDSLFFLNRWYHNKVTCPWVENTLERWHKQIKMTEADLLERFTFVCLVEAYCNANTKELQQTLQDALRSPRLSRLEIIKELVASRLPQRKFLP